MRSKSLPKPIKMPSRKTSKKQCLKFMIFNGFWSQNGANLAIFNPTPGPFLPTWAPPCAKIAPRWLPDLIFACFWEPFLMFLEPILKVFGLILVPLKISKRCQKHAKYFLVPPQIACLKTSGGRRCTPVGVFDNIISRDDIIII